MKAACGRGGSRERDGIHNVMCSSNCSNMLSTVNYEHRHRTSNVLMRSLYIHIRDKDNFIIIYAIFRNPEGIRNTWIKHIDSLAIISTNNWLRVRAKPYRIYEFSLRYSYYFKPQILTGAKTEVLIYLNRLRQFFSDKSIHTIFILVVS